MKNTFGVIIFTLAASVLSFSQMPTPTPIADETLRLCVASVQTKQYEAAITDCGKAIAKSPNKPEGYRGRAIAHANLKNMDAALADMTKAIELAPDNFQLFGLRGEFYASMQKLDSALADFNKALQLNPKDQRALYRRAQIYSHLGKKDLALADLKAILAINPNQADAKKALAQLEPEPTKTEFFRNAKLKIAFQIPKNSVKSNEFDDAVTFDGERGIFEKVTYLHFAPRDIESGTSSPDQQMEVLAFEYIKSLVGQDYLAGLQSIDYFETEKKRLKIGGFNALKLVSTMKDVRENAAPNRKVLVADFVIHVPEHHRFYKFHVETPLQNHEKWLANAEAAINSFEILKSEIPTTTVATTKIVVNNPKWEKFKPTAKLLMKYQTFGSFSEGLAAARRSDGEKKWGFIDKTGKEVIPPTFSYVYPFSEGLARTSTDVSGGKMGLIDKTGKEIIPPTHTLIGQFSDGLAWAYFDIAKKGFIDKTGKTVIPEMYRAVDDFKEGLAPVMLEIGGPWGFIDKNNKMVIPAKYARARPFSEGLAQVAVITANKTLKYGYIDKTGKEVVPPIYDLTLPFKNGLARVTSGDQQTGKTGMIDKTGKVIIPLKYSTLDVFIEGLASATIKDSQPTFTGFIDKTGKPVITLENVYASSFSEGLAYVEYQRKIGFIDKTGKEVIPMKYESTWCNGFRSEGFIGVVLNGKRGFVDSLGNEYFDF